MTEALRSIHLSADIFTTMTSSDFLLAQLMNPLLLTYLIAVHNKCFPPSVFFDPGFSSRISQVLF
jgi:hypothetical protein